VPKRVDKNQAEIVTALRKLGFSVLHLHEVGRGCPDILVGKNGVNLLVEIKSTQKASFTEAEIRFASEWDGSVIAAYRVQDILNWFERHEDD